MASGLLLQVTEQFCLLCSIKCCKIPQALLLEEISVWVLRRGWEPRVHFEAKVNVTAPSSEDRWPYFPIRPHPYILLELNGAGRGYHLSSRRQERS